ncbi:MAG: hypothetical protein JST54_31320 [Deltaproteobacteria bacterium]|nr:hypothetical protein [Deltaproteobacteria bacterium]
MPRLSKLGLACALALAGCATTVSGENGAVSSSTSVDVAGAPQPVQAMVEHEGRELDAVKLLRDAIAACDTVQSNAHRLPSEFFSAERNYEDQRDQAMLLDGSLRESKQGYSPHQGAPSSTYEDWIVRCDLFFQSNRDSYAAAQDAEVDAAAKSKPAAGTLTTCKVLGGRAAGCGAPFTGHAPLLREGVWRQCEIEAGKPTSCGDAIEGQAVVSHDGLVRSCDLEAGKVMACSTSGYDGAAVLPTP